MHVDSFGAGVLCTFFCAWFFLSAACQLPTGLATRIRGWDPLNLLPTWSFFAPHPGTHDLHLLYRDRLPDGTCSVWREVLPPKPSRFVSPLWNPGRRHTKALFDLTKNLVLEAKAHREAPQVLQLSLPYLALLYFVSRQPRPYQASMTQFLLMRTERLASLAAAAGEPATVFLSFFHSL